MRIASVVIDSNTKKTDKIFDYSIPAVLHDTAVFGVRVFVPFGKSDKKTLGYIIKTYDGEPEFNLKEILSVIDEKPIFNRKTLLEAYWIKNRFFSSFCDAIKLFLPPGSGQKLTEWVLLCSDEYDEKYKDILDILKENNGTVEYLKLKDLFGNNIRAKLNKMKERGLISFYSSNVPRITPKVKKVVKLAKTEDEYNLSSKAQERAVNIMTQCEMLTVSDLCLFASCSSATVRTLVKKGIFEYDSIEVFRTPNKGSTCRDEAVVLNEAQENAVNFISSQSTADFKPVLLRGVTGSGKTEIYLAVIEKFLKNNKSAIILVPEISLTYQMVSRFLSRFGEKVAVLHSGLSAGERYDEWRRISKGEARVVIGARSAIFAPCENLGIIIMDEEHEDTYKSESGVHYHARDVAICRGSTENAVVVLASATPSIESYYKAKSGIYSLIEIDKRFNKCPLPETKIVDMRREMEEGNRSPISNLLKEEIEKNIENNDQTILFLNRRGYSTFVSCRSCGHVLECPNCSISLTYHSISESMMCHYCGHRIRKPDVCPSCGSKHVYGFGIGTQKIEEIIGEKFKGSTVIRMDVDTTKTKEAHEKILTRFKRDKINILLGTQMISKGLDFEDVTLVGVLAADQILHLDDYKAAERTFALITQVCGRAGRGNKKGRAVIQTYSPDSPVIQKAAAQDYVSFYQDEIIIRKALNYPPFCDIINITVSDTNKEKAIKIINNLQMEIKNALGSRAKVFRVVPCIISKINNKYRFHFWIKCVLNKEICGEINAITGELSDSSVIIDVNPVSI